MIQITHDDDTFNIMLTGEHQKICKAQCKEGDKPQDIALGIMIIMCLKALSSSGAREQMLTLLKQGVSELEPKTTEKENA